MTIYTMSPFNIYLQPEIIAPKEEARSAPKQKKPHKIAIYTHFSLSKRVNHGCTSQINNARRKGATGQAEEKEMNKLKVTASIIGR